jgi:2-(1,2-epoxy-1,2-dihydrophenyl)acetyl-CoA isomerase
MHVPYKTLRIETRESATLIELSRPDFRHALNAALVEELTDAIRGIDDSVSAVILTAAGPVFCAGADLSAFPPAEAKSCATNEEAAACISSQIEGQYNDLIRAVRSCRRPVIAALNGHAVGGGAGLALAADALIMSHDATIQLPFIPKLGLVPDMGTAWFLARATGAATANRLCLTGATLDAVEAKRLGLAWSHHEQDDLMVAALSLAGALAEIASPLLQAFRSQIDGLPARSLADQLELEAVQQGRLAAGPEFLDRIERYRRRAA